MHLEEGGRWTSWQLEGDLPTYDWQPPSSKHQVAFSLPCLHPFASSMPHVEPYRPIAFIS
jgi:hypothetical protein